MSYENIQRFKINHQVYVQICQATKDSTLTTLMDQVRNCSFLTDIDKAQKEERGACDTGRKQIFGQSHVKISHL